MALADTQLYQLASFDPYTAMVQAPMQRKQAEIQAMETEQAYKEAQAEQAQKSLPQMAGAVGQAPTGLAQMAPSVFPPNVKLQTETGEPTVAGEFSQNLAPYLTVQNSANKAIKDAAGIRRMASGESDPTKRAGMLRQAAEIESKARLDNREAVNGSKKVIDEFYGDLATRYVNAMNASSQKEYDNELESWNRNSGFAPFKDAPERYGPETREKLREYMKTLPPPLQEKIKEKLKAERKEQDAIAAAKRAETMAVLAERRDIRAEQREARMERRELEKEDEYKPIVATLQQDVQTGYYRMNKILENSKPGKIAGGSPFLLTWGKNTGLLAAAEGAALRGAIPEGLAQNDAALLGVAFDVASARSGGRGQLSDSKIYEVLRQMPIQNDKESVKADKIDYIFNQLDSANKDLPKSKRVDKGEFLKNEWDKEKYLAKPKKGESSGLSSEDLDLLKKYE